MRVALSPWIRCHSKACPCQPAADKAQKVIFGHQNTRQIHFHRAPMTANAFVVIMLHEALPGDANSSPTPTDVVLSRLCSFGTDADPFSCAHFRRAPTTLMMRQRADAGNGALIKTTLQDAVVIGKLPLLRLPPLTAGIFSEPIRVDVGFPTLPLAERRKDHV